MSSFGQGHFRRCHPGRRWHPLDEPGRHLQRANSQIRNSIEYSPGIRRRKIRERERETRGYLFSVEKMMRSRNVVGARLMEVGDQVQPKRESVRPVVVLQFRLELWKHG